MIALVLMQIAAIDGSPLGAIGRQALPARGCAAYLFSTGETKALAAMATADPATLRVRLDGRTIDLPRTAEQGAAGLGFAAETEYRTTDVVARLTLTISQRGDIAKGAAVPEASLLLDRAGADTVVMPLGGLVACV